jgi:hypothetical protein
MLGSLHYSFGGVIVSFIIIELYPFMLIGMFYIVLLLINGTVGVNGLLRAWG